MRIVDYRDPADYQRVVEPWLLAREAENCLLLGNLLALRRREAGSTPAGELSEPRLWTAEDPAGAIAAVALQLTHRAMVFTRGPDAAMDRLADQLTAVGWSGRYLNGIRPSIERLVERFAAASGRTASVFRSLRTFELREVIAPRAAPGEMRLCTAADQSQLEAWMADFAHEINEPDTPENLRTKALMIIQEQRAFFWVHQTPVAMAVWSGRTPNGRRVNFVYTPQDHRGKGYASNLVAGLSRHILETGSSLCCLFTDLANPVSNRIYQTLGYRPVCDSQVWQLADVADAPETDGRADVGRRP